MGTQEAAVAIRAQCIVQASNFIKAAERLVSINDFTHIVYHLSLLALEEVGKGNMVVARAIVGNKRESTWIDKSLESHTRKLQWALWSRLHKIDPQEFEDARHFAEHWHALRLTSLYVNANADETDVPDKELITVERATTVLEFAKARLALENSSAIPTGEPDDLLEWFLETLTDEERSRIIFSKDFIDKHKALHGDTREWVKWARDEFDRLDREANELLQSELARAISTTETSKPKWRVTATVYTPSHSLRAKVLAVWNERMDMAKLNWTGKKDSFQLQLTFNDSAPLQELYGRAVSLSKLIVACLNMGSIGYFWFQRPGFEHRFFKDIRDLEHPNMSLEIGKPESFWDDGRAVALTEQHITHATECMMAFIQLSETEAEPIFAPYFHGLALIAKSDTFYSLDDVARREFAASLGGALHKYAGWDGAIETFKATFHNAFSAFMPEQEHRDLMFRVLSPKGDPNESSLANLRTTKHLADLYLIHVARKTWRTILDKK